jgi:hypothetical protein
LNSPTGMIKSRVYIESKERIRFERRPQY